jgi:hypothetical protein
MTYVLEYLNRQDQRKQVDIKADSAKEAERQFRVTHPTCDRIQKINIKEATE